MEIMRVCLKSELCKGRKGNLVLAIQGRKVVIFTNVLYNDVKDKLEEKNVYRAYYEIIRETDRVVFAKLKRLTYRVLEKRKGTKDEVLEFRVGKYTVRKKVKRYVEWREEREIDILTGKVVDEMKTDETSEMKIFSLSSVLEEEFPKLAELAKELEEYSAEEIYNLVIAMKHGAEIGATIAYILSVVLSMARRLADELGIKVVKEDEKFIYFNDGTEWFKGDMTCEPYFNTRAEGTEYIEGRLWLLLVADWILRKHIGEEKINKFIY